MQNEKSLCKQCKCLDTTSQTDSGYVCLVGGNMENPNSCKLLLRKKPVVKSLITCTKTLTINDSAQALIHEDYVIRKFPDGTEKVTSQDNEEPICLVESNEFKEHFEIRDISNFGKMVLLNKQGEQGLHKVCGSPVYENEEMSRFCIDKSCTGSYYGIDIMEELVKN